MKTLLFFLFIVPVICVAQAPADTVSLNEGNFHTAWSHSAKYPVKVYWHLTADMLNCSNGNKRTKAFGPDPQLRAETNLDSDYSHSGYERGHNFNAADDSCATPELYAKCWYFTNMTPQTSNLNRGTWLSLEKQCRTWASSGDDLLIECGSYGKLKTIGPHKVWVPEFCWKVIHHKSGEIDAYIMPNTNNVTQHRLSYYHTDVAVVEQKTGLTGL